MHTTEFVHLHNHTEYSLLDGACRIVDDRGNPSELIKFIAAQKMPAFAITDHGNMFGVVEFYLSCRNAGIKPIIGCEIYLTSGSRFVKDQSQKTYHLTLLCKNNKGYENLMRLVSAGYIEGFYYKPRVDKELLKKYADGIICLSGCIHGEISEAILAGNEQVAVKFINEYKNIYGKENFYIELMNNGMAEQKVLLPKLIELAKQTATPVVATNDSHYLRKEDAAIHDILLCIGTGVTLDNPKRLKFPTDEFYYRSTAEITTLFNAIPEAIKNTIKIAEQCNVELNFDQLLLPNYEVPSGYTQETFLKKLCAERIKLRYPTITKEIENRLNYELELITKMGLAAYFLIVADFVDYAKKNNIPVGPGRGSGAGSLVAYVLGITDICPITYGLLFERFLNPERRTMPDLDIDFADWGRDMVINYVRKKYGNINVAQIITFGTMQARLVIRDVARVLGFKPAEADKIAKLIPQGMTIYQALNSVAELKSIYETTENIKKLIDIAREIEGLKRHAGVHAAGLVIAKDEITKFCPLAISTRDKEQKIIITQYNDDALIKLGLLKIDFLGLKTLTVIQQTLKLVSPEFDVTKIPLDDRKTFSLLQQAKTIGVFQLESAGMRDLLRKLKPTVFEDIIALVALYRPGPMGSGMLDEFVHRKHQKTEIKYDHSSLEPILKETYGVIVYQEQVMQIAKRLAGFSASQADILRQAMGKKIPEEIKQQHKIFLEGAKKENIDRKIAEKIFSQIEHFGSYGFNKSHAAAYALIAYRTAYLKANYPLEYMTALLTSEIARSTIGREQESRFIVYIQEAKDMGIQILPPDVNKSCETFTIENGAIRYALLAIKNVGEQAVKEIVSKRTRGGPFKTLQDFLSRVDSRQVNKKVVESLIKAGALDCFGIKDDISLPSYIRAKQFSLLEKIYSNKDKFSLTQKTLFEFEPQIQEKIEPWPDYVLLGYEKEVLGFYFSGHPMAQYKELLDIASTHKLNELENVREVDSIRIAGMIASIKRLTTKDKSAQMAKFKLENFYGELDVLVFPKLYQEVSKLLTPQALITVKGKLSNRDEKPTLIADEIITLDKFEAITMNQSKELILKFSCAGVDDVFLEQLKKILTKSTGYTTVYFKITSHTKEEVLIKTPIKTHLTDKLFTELKALLGENSWEVR